MKQKDYALQKLKIIFFIKLLTVVVGSSLAQSNMVAGSKQNDPRMQGARPSIRGNGLCFTPNKGQIADRNGKLCPDVLYKGDDGGTDIYLRKTGISYVHNNMGEVQHEIDEQVEELIKAGIITEADEHKRKEELMQKESIKVHRVDMDFANCLPAGQAGNENIKQLNEAEVDGYTNYYYAHCPQGITNVKQYNKVTYKNIYKGVDVCYYGEKQNGIKYDLIVHPHADPNQIKLNWKGAKSMHLNHDGNLVIKTSVNEFYESIPKVYQNINGKIINVKARYVLNGTTVNFELGTWNPTLPLVIDPWATYYGGMGTEMSGGIDTDNLGNVLITGHTYSPSFPVIAGGYSQPFGGMQDVFVVKFSTIGTPLWSTFYGGGSDESGNDIASDNANNIYITGTTSSPTFPVFAGGGYSQLFKGMQDIFIVKFNSAGIRLNATFYGGSSFDTGEGIDIDNNGNIFITGTTGSFDFPILTPGAAYAQPLGFIDIFVVKFDNTGTLIWSTFYGGGGADDGTSIATDITGNVFITGSTEDNSFPIFAGTGYIQGCLAFLHTVVIIKFDNGGVRQWATCYGGSGVRDDSSDITIDNANNVLISGTTLSADFPVLPAGGYSQPYGGMGDAFVAKFNNLGVLLWATFYGSTQAEFGFGGVATDLNNNIYLLMEPEDMAVPDLVDPCSYQQVFNGGATATFPEDQLIVKFNSVGKKVCATYLGGTGHDDLDGYPYGAGGIAIFGNSLYITGFTDGGYPVTPGAAQTVFGGGYDVFVTSLCTNICEGKILALDYTANTTSVCANAPVTFTPSVSNSCDLTGYTYQWTFSGGTPSTSTAVTPTITFSDIGTHDVQLTVTTPCKTANLTKSASVTSCGGITANVNSATLCSGATPCPTLTATGGSGTAPYTYLWSPGTGLSATTGSSVTACPITTTNYTVTVTDNTGTTATSTAVVTVNSAVTPTFNSVAAICAGATLASLPTTSNNGITGTWSPALNNTTTTTYTFTPTAGQCANTATLTIAVNTSATPTFNSAAAICSGATLAALPTTSNNSITGTWSPALNNTATNTYTFTPTAGQCANTVALTIVINPTVNVTTTPTHITCNGLGNGSAIASGSAGTGVYTYSWSTLVSGSTVSGLTSGSYSVTVTDSKGCTSISTTTILVPAPLIGQFTKGTANCIGCSCKEWIMVNALGGTSPYTYLWPDGYTKRYKNQLCPGNYKINITDKNGCSVNVNLITP